MAGREAVDEARAWAWVAALRAGSTVPWSAWLSSEPPGDASTAPRTARDLPGAQQLELARRVNLAAATPGTAVDDSARARVVERALGASAAGRGAPELGLVGAVVPRPWGTPPVDPAVLTAHDLLRVAVTLVAQDVVASGAEPAGLAVEQQPSPLASVTAAPGRVRRRLGRVGRGTGHRLVGDPWLVASVHEEVRRRGRPLGHPGATVVVVGADAATLLVDAFTASSFGRGAPPWRRWLASGTGGGLPVRADLAATAAHAADQVGHRRVLVVPDPALLPDALHLPPRAAARLLPPRPSADAVDLARRTAAPLGLLAPPDERRLLLRRVLLPQLLADGARHPAPPLAVPPQRLPWVVRRAERMRDDLRAAGYPVLGDLQALVPAAEGPDRLGAAPDEEGVLALAVRLLLAAPAREHRDHTHRERSEDT